MHKKELIVKLKNLSTNRRWKGQISFSKFLIFYLENLNIPADEKYDHWRIEPYLHDICVDAFEELRTSEDPKIAKFRKQYEDDTGHEVPNVLDLGVSHLFDRGNAVQTTIGFLLADVLEDRYITSQVDAYCNAQSYVLQQTFDKFLRQVYRRGMFKLINESNERGMSAVFGDTVLRTYTICGRIMFTFANKEEDVTFIAEDGDPLCYSSGLQSINTEFRGALDLIEDVIKHWPEVQAAARFKNKELFIV